MTGERVKEIMDDWQSKKEQINEEYQKKLDSAIYLSEINECQVWKSEQLKKLEREVWEKLKEK
jgi:hypothetical protein